MFPTSFLSPRYLVCIKYLSLPLSFVTSSTLSLLCAPLLCGFCILGSSFFNLKLLFEFKSRLPAGLCTCLEVDEDCGKLPSFHSQNQILETVI